MKNAVILIFLICIIFIGCNSQSDKLERYEIIKTDTGSEYINLDIRIFSNLNKQQLIDISSKLREDQFGKNEKLLFFLPDQQRGKNLSYGMVIYPKSPTGNEPEKDNNGDAMEITIEK